jgi:hypothetical protein
MTNNCIEALKRHRERLKTNDVHGFYLDLLEDMSKNIIKPVEIGNITSYFLNKNPNSRKLLLDNLIAIPDYFLYEQDEPDFVIPKYCDLIGSKAFSHTNIRHLVIPSNIGVVQALACNSNEYIEEITIEEGVKIIGDWAFGDCPVLNKITIPSSVRYIGREITQYSSNVTIYCNEGSEAHKYAKEEHLRYIFV